MDGEAPERQTVRLRIEGLVQGVGFRAFVVQEATRLGLDGWVRNRRDGGVEAVVCGPPPSIETLVARCRIGPRAGRVDMLKVLDEPDHGGTGFEVRPTA